MKNQRSDSKARLYALKNVSENGYDLGRVGKDFQGDAQVVRLAVSRNGTALQFASEELRNDKDIAICAILNSPFAYQFVSDTLRVDKDIVRIAAKKDAAGRGYPSLEFATDKDKADKSIDLAAVKRNGFNFPFVSDALREDADVIAAAYEQLGIEKSGNALIYKNEEIIDSPRQTKAKRKSIEKRMRIEGSGVQVRFTEVSKNVYDRLRKSEMSIEALKILLEDGDVIGGMPLHTSLTSDPS